MTSDMRSQVTFASCHLERVESAPFSLSLSHMQKRNNGDETRLVVYYSAVLFCTRARARARHLARLIFRYSFQINFFVGDSGAPKSLAGLPRDRSFDLRSALSEERSLDFRLSPLTFGFVPPGRTATWYFRTLDVPIP